mmetsp:Transcript_3001/g.3364  ORF Transcript_3001/g.3364 Transcript_3001/m.3364 type:complete len:316 (-) Transcript_3001:59-1006(-)
MADDMKSLFSSFERQLEEKKKKLIDDAMRVETEKRQLEEEKDRMKNHHETNPNDIIELNIGGTHMTTTRLTLCQIKGSLLEIMFSGRWEDNLILDKEGRIFLDVDPDYFALILKTLRSMRMAKEPGLIEFQRQCKADVHLSVLASYYGLLSEDHMMDYFSTTSGKSALRKEHKLLFENIGEGFCSALGARKFSKGVIKWTLEIATLENDGWMMIGVLSNSDKLIPQSCNLPTCHSWTVSSCYKQGKAGVSATQSYRTGDIVCLTLDCDNAVLKLRNMRSGQVRNMHLVPDQQWRLHVNLFYASNSIRLLTTEFNA